MQETENDTNVFKDVLLIDKAGWCGICCTLEFAASPEGKILAQAMQDINKMRKERKNEA